jgi:catenin beta 1
MSVYVKIIAFFKFTVCIYFGSYLQQVKLMAFSLVGTTIPLGYDQIPIDSMQGLEIGSHHGAGGGGGSTYGPMDAMDVGGPDSSDLNFDHLDELPQPPQDNNQVAAWYDTDL